VLTWVKTDSPAWQAGMRPGDRIYRIGTREVASWEDILDANGAYGREGRMIRWYRGGEAYARVVAPVRELLPAAAGTDGTLALGILFKRPKTTVRRYGLWGSVKMGFYKTFATVAEFLVHLKMMASRKISPRVMGGPLTIALISYSAAQQGLGKLLYLTAFISAMLAFVNILPIPILDGGHLLFAGIEKLRGRPLSQTVMSVAQYVGLVLLLMLVVYVTRNDILRILQLYKG